MNLVAWVAGTEIAVVRINANLRTSSILLSTFINSKICLIYKAPSFMKKLIDKFTVCINAQHKGHCLQHLFIFLTKDHVAITIYLPQR